MERMVQNGMTVVDGPELIWADCIKENRTTKDPEGYEVRSWSFYTSSSTIFSIYTGNSLTVLYAFPPVKKSLTVQKSLLFRTLTAVVMTTNTAFTRICLRGFIVRKMTATSKTTTILSNLRDVTRLYPLYTLLQMTLQNQFPYR